MCAIKGAVVSLLLAVDVLAQDTVFIHCPQEYIPIDEPSVILSNTHPVSGETLTIALVKGIWGDNCIPGYSTNCLVEHPSDENTGIINLDYSIVLSSGLSVCTDVMTPYGPKFTVDTLLNGTYLMVDGNDTLETVSVTNTERTFSLTGSVVKRNPASDVYYAYEDFTFSLWCMETDYIPGGAVAGILSVVDENSNGVFTVSDLPGKTYRLAIHDEENGYVGSTQWFNLNSDTTVYFAVESCRETDVRRSPGGTGFPAGTEIHLSPGSNYRIPADKTGQYSVAEVYGLNGKRISTQNISKEQRVVNFARGNGMLIVKIK